MFRRKPPIVPQAQGQQHPIKQNAFCVNLAGLGSSAHDKITRRGLQTRPSFNHTRSSFAGGSQFLVKYIGLRGGGRSIRPYVHAAQALQEPLF
jgi:hypothetical protein